MINLFIFVAYHKHFIKEVSVIGYHWKLVY